METPDAVADPMRIRPAPPVPDAFETVEFTARDGFGLNFRRLRPSPDAPNRGPVMLVPGAGVRAELFSPPTTDTLPRMLARNGFDVWALNWRASIDLPPNHYTLDDAAVHDYPAAVATVLHHTGVDEIKALIHCQGSTSFMMSITAGLLPQVSTVISNSVALHPVVPRLAWFKLPIATDTVGKHIEYFNPQWGIHASGFWPKMLDWAVRSVHHECNNAVCKHSSFTYGSGFPTLWKHENLDDATHEWIKGEFAHVPTTFFRQIARCVAAGHLVSTGTYDELPDSFVAAAPATDARFVFMTGDENHCFRPEAMARTFDFFEKFAPGRHTFRTLAGYGHLDVFLGKDAATDTFGFILDELSR